LPERHDFLWQHDRKAEAKEFYETTIESKPEHSIELGIRFAECYESIGDSKNAALLYTTLYERVMKSGLNPTESDFYSKLTAIEKASECSHLNSRTDFAVSLWKTACTSYPGIPILWNKYGFFLQYRAKDHDAAIKAYQQAIRLETDSTEAFSLRISLAQVLRGVGRLEEAEVELKTLIARLENMYILPLNEAVDGNLGHLRSLFPGLATLVYQDLADVYSIQGRTLEALAVLQEGIQQVPSYPVLFRNLAETYIRLGNTSQAIESYRSYFRVFPNDYQESKKIMGAHGLLGHSVCTLVDLFIQENRIHDARDFLSREHTLKRNTQGLDDDPSNEGSLPRYEASLHWAEANLLVAEGRAAESIIEYEQCVEIQPQLHLAWARLAATHGVCRDFSKAVECQEKAIDAQKLRKYTGVGTLTLPFEGSEKIVTVSPDSPADQAGIKVGDIIVAIDGLRVPMSKIGLRLPGTRVTLTIKRNLDESLQDITLTHEETMPPRLVEYQGQLAAYKAGKQWRGHEL